jgi:predicted DNA-binding mobile mystery protein A
MRLDARLGTIKAAGRDGSPAKGWIRAIRDALGMSGAQLAKRMGVAAQTVDRLEKGEVAGRIQLSSLRRAAEAMDCTLVYALVPKDTLQGIVEARARAVARAEMTRVAHTMRLEAQGTGAGEHGEQLEGMVRQLIDSPALWRDA